MRRRWMTIALALLVAPSWARGQEELPAPGGIGTAQAKGKDSESSLSPSLLTLLNEQAAQENNQIH